MLSLRVRRRLEHPVFLCSRRRGSRQSRLDPSPTNTGLWAYPKGPSSPYLRTLAAFMGTKKP